MLLEPEGADDGQVVADATVVDGADVGAIGFIATVCLVGLDEEWEGEDARVDGGEGGGVGDDVVEGGPESLVFVSAWFECVGLVGEVALVGQLAELGRVAIGVEVAHDDDVWMAAKGVDGVGVGLELLEDVDAVVESDASASLGGEVDDVYVEGVAIENGAGHMQDVAGGVVGQIGVNVLGVDGVEGVGRIE